MVKGVTFVLSRLRAALCVICAVSLPVSSFAQLKPDYVNALWLLQEHRLLKIATADGNILLQLRLHPEVQSLAVDRSRGIVWLVSANNIQAIDFAGNPLRQFSLSLPRKDEASRDHHQHENAHDEDKEKFRYKDLRILVNEADGSLWLHSKKSLWHVSAQGEPLLTLAIKHDITALVWVPSQQQLWVASKKLITIYDQANGLPVKQIRTESEIKNMAYDTALDEIWLSSEKRLQRLSVDGSQTYQQRWHGLASIKPDEQGKLWLTTKKTLFYLDASGALLFELNPFGGEKSHRIKLLAVDSATQSVWLTNEHELVQVDTQGVVQQRSRLHGETEDMALYADVIPPVLSFNQPEEDSYLNTATPVLALQHNDNGIGTAPETLQLQQDGVDLVVNCQHTETSSSCQPVTPMNEGLTNLSATIRDYAGNESTPATRSFTVDTIAPTISLDSHWNGTYVNQSAQTLSGTVSEFAVLTMNEQPLILGLNNIFNTPVLLLEGQNNFLFKAQDLATNESSLPFVLFLDTQPPLAAVVGKIEIGDAVNGQVAITGQAGSVESLATVEITNTTTQQVSTTLAGTEGSFSLRVAANPGDALQIVVIDKATNRSPQSQLSVPLPLAVAMTSPVAEANIVYDSVNIEGTYKGPMNTGISINGYPAEVTTDGRFILNGLPLTAGVNTLEAVLTTRQGNTVSHIISVTSSGQASSIKFEPNFNAGPAPLDMEFEFGWYRNEAINKIDIDFEGDGNIDFTTNLEQDAFAHTYRQPGIYRPNVTVTTDIATYHQQAILRVFDKSELITILTAQWNEMNDALVQGNIELALTYLDEKARYKYGPVFEALKHKMPTIIQSYSPLQPVDFYEDIGEFVVNRDHNGRKLAFLIYYLKNYDGVWRLNTM